METMKIYIVGDGNVGKTSLLITYTSNVCPTDDYIPTVFNTQHPSTVMVDGREAALHFWDTVGGEDFDHLRPLTYPNTDVFLLCFSLIQPSPLDNVRVRWFPELTHHCPNIPIVMIGTKMDMRDRREENERKGIRVITYEEGLEMAEKVNAVKYLECSSITQQGLHNVIDEAVRAARKPAKSQTTNNCMPLLNSY